MSTYEATQAEQAAEVGDLRAALTAVQAENLTLQVLSAAANPLCYDARSSCPAAMLPHCYPSLSHSRSQSMAGVAASCHLPDMPVSRTQLPL